MGILKYLNRANKKSAEEFKKRRDAFFEEYKKIAYKYNCDWSGVLEISKDQSSAHANVRIIDATLIFQEEREKQEKEKQEKEKNENNQSKN